jgi:hypothetical protein
MALPKLNAVPKYELTIPSLGKQVKYRPYLVKEEKVLMMSFESGDKRATLNAVVDTIFSCLEENNGISPSSLTTFDVEYMFTQIRAKSVGEVARIRVKCNHCEHFNDQEVDLESVGVDIPKTNVIDLTEDISIKMKYPSYKVLITKDLESENQIELGFDMITECIESIRTADEQFIVKDQSKEELQEFIESFTTDQFEKIVNFLNTMPKMEKVLEFNCISCGEENKVKLEGMSDFF